MRITREKIEKLPDGTKLKIFLSGSDWEEDFGKSMTVFKFKNQVFEYKLLEIEDMGSGDQWIISDFDEAYEDKPGMGKIYSNFIEFIKD